MRYVCPKCGRPAATADATIVPIYRGMPDGQYWFCEKCKLLAPLGDNGEPVCELSDNVLWSMRLSVRDMLLHLARAKVDRSGGKIDLRQAMADGAKWLGDKVGGDMRLFFFVPLASADDCRKATAVLEPYMRVRR